MNRDENKTETGRLPDSHMVCDIILNLPEPVHVMAWLMAETGCRFYDLSALRVRDIGVNSCTVSYRGEGGEPRRLPLSAGLVRELVSYMHELRELFERDHRREVRRSQSPSATAPMFPDQLLFPAWSLAGYERAPVDRPFPAAVFVGELSEAAALCGFDGGMHSHTLRLCCAARWIEEGTGLRDLHDRLGHRDMMTTLMMVQALQADGLAFTGDVRPRDRSSAPGVRAA